MARWGMLLIAIVLAVAGTLWSWGEWASARRSLLEAAQWRNEVRSFEEQLVALRSQLASLEFVVPATSDQALYDQIRRAQQKAQVTFDVSPYQEEAIKSLPGLTIGRFRSLSFEGTLRQWIVLLEALENTDPYWIRLQRVSIKPGTKVEQGQAEQLKFEFELRCLINTAAIAG